jgi:hypothetical protein
LKDYHEALVKNFGYGINNLHACETADSFYNKKRPPIVGSNLEL